MPKTFEQAIRRVVDRTVARTLAATGISPTVFTLAAPVLMLGVLALLAGGWLVWAALLLAFVSMFDMLDGALARAYGQSSALGAFLDSSLDRYSEAFMFFGLLLYQQRVAPGSIDVLLIYAVIVGSLLTSYTRARAEALGFDGKVGLLERPGRVVIAVIGLLTGLVTVMLWVLAVLTNITALQRILHVWRQSRSARATPS